MCVCVCVWGTQPISSACTLFESAYASLPPPMADWTDAWFRRRSEQGRLKTNALPLDRTSSPLVKLSALHSLGCFP